MNMTQEQKVLTALSIYGPMLAQDLATKLKLTHKNQIYVLLSKLYKKGLVKKLGQQVILVKDPSPEEVEQINRAVETVDQEKIPQPDIKVAILQEEIDECDRAIDHYQRVRAYLRSRVTELQF
jgi:sugar-specific transcriptional regulator TrmB